MVVFMYSFEMFKYFLMETTYAFTILLENWGSVSHFSHPLSPIKQVKELRQKSS